MPDIPIIMPQLGESIAEATVTQFRVNVGDPVRADQEVMEVETKKPTMGVTAPAVGTVKSWLAKLEESYPVGAVLGYLEITAEVATRMGLDAPVPSEATAKSAPAAASA